MQIPSFAFLLLHLASVLPALAALSAPRVRGHVALFLLPFIASLFLLLKHGGWWVDMSRKVSGAGLLLLIPWALFLWLGNRSKGRMAATARSLARAGGFLYGGFFLAVGVQALRNGTPLATFPALELLLLGAMLLLPVRGRRTARLAAALLVAAALAGAAGIFGLSG